MAAVLTDRRSNADECHAERSQTGKRTMLYWQYGLTAAVIVLLLAFCIKPWKAGPNAILADLTFSAGACGTLPLTILSEGAL